MGDRDALVAAIMDLVEADDAPGVASAMSALTETERRAVWKVLSGRHIATAAGAVAVLGSAPGTRSVEDRAWVIGPAHPALPDAARVLTDRRPPWLEQLATRLIGEETGSPWGFALVRALVRDGVVAEPSGPGYVMAMIHGLAPYRLHASRLTVADGLRRDPGLLDDLVWHLLATERAGRRLADHDRWVTQPVDVPSGVSFDPAPEATWRHALLTLTAAGALDRDRVLDATLHAMAADWAAADVGWFVGLHDAIGPSDDELVARKETYLRLPSSDLGTVAKAGIHAAGRLGGAGVPPGEIVPALEAPLTGAAKGLAMSALALLERLAEDEPGCRHAVAQVARAASEHPNADVRERASGLRRRCGASTSEACADELLPVTSGGDVAEPMAGLRPVEPVTGADEVAELLAHLIEEADDPIAVERARDGGRLVAGVTPAAAEALAARAAERVDELYPGPWSGEELRSDLAALALVWLGRGCPCPGYPGRLVGYDARERSDDEVELLEVRRPDWSLAALLTMRVHEVASSIGHGPGFLVSLPTRSDGALTAQALNARLRGLCFAPPGDLELAVLRVPPEERSQIAVPRLLHGGMAVESALTLLATHPPRWQRVVGPTTDQWELETATMVGWADPTSPPGAPDRVVAAVLDRREPLARAGLEAADGEYTARAEQPVAMWPLLLPHEPDLLAAHAHPRLARALTKNRSGAAPIVAALGGSDRPCSGPTWSALVLALAAQEVGVRVSAVDAVVARARRGAVDAPGLAEQIRSCLDDGIVVGTRVVDSLAETARADRMTAGVVLDVLVETLPALPGRRDAHRWVEVVAELSQVLDRAVALPTSFRNLAESNARSVLAKACRRVQAAR